MCLNLYVNVPVIDACHNIKQLELFLNYSVEWPELLCPVGIRRM